MTENDRNLLLKIWGILRGVGTGAPLDADYARELADALEPLTKSPDYSNLPARNPEYL